MTNQLNDEVLRESQLIASGEFSPARISSISIDGVKDGVYIKSDYPELTLHLKFSNLDPKSTYGIATKYEPLNSNFPLLKFAPSTFDRSAMIKDGDDFCTYADINLDKLDLIQGKLKLEVALLRVLSSSGDEGKGIVHDTRILTFEVR